MSATSPARVRLLAIITARRSSRSARTPANGPIVNHGIDRNPSARPTAAGLPVSWFTYTARAMNVTKEPASDTQSAVQNIRSSRPFRTANTETARRRSGVFTGGHYRAWPRRAGLPADALGEKPGRSADAQARLDRGGVAPPPLPAG